MNPLGGVARIIVKTSVLQKSFSPCKKHARSYKKVLWSRNTVVHVLPSTISLYYYHNTTIIMTFHNSVFKILCSLSASCELQIICTHFFCFLTFTYFERGRN